MKQDFYFEVIEIETDKVIEKGIVSGETKIEAENKLKWKLSHVLKLGVHIIEIYQRID